MHLDTGDSDDAAPNAPAPGTGATPDSTPLPRGSVREVFLIFRVFLRLGVTSFGGPAAHLGYFRAEAVERRRWLDDREYADLVALCQFLPGPASSQVGFALGLRRAGVAGAVAAFLAFTLPSVALMVAFAYGASWVAGPVGEGVITGLKITAVAVVAQAVLGMARSLAPDRRRASIAVFAAVAALLLAGSAGQPIAIAFGALAGLLLCRDAATATARANGTANTANTTGTTSAAGAPGATGTGEVDGRANTSSMACTTGTTSTTDTTGTSAAAGTSTAAGTTRTTTVPRVFGVACLAVFAVLFIALPLISASTGAHGLALFEAFFHSGSLVFGGGHVVLPLLETSVVSPGWVGEHDFLTGYGAAQAVPGPLFSFGAYLGAISTAGPGGALGALIATVGIFLPGFLLLLGALPFWDALRARPRAQAALRGANAAVVGILFAALYSPVFTSAITGAAPLALAACCFVLLVAWKAPPWVAVLVGAAGGIPIALFA